MQNTEQNAVLLRLAREYGDSVVRMCCVYLKDYHLAQDVAQETFLQAARKYGALARTDSEKAWLMRIAVNRCKNELRTQWFRRAQELPEPSGADPYPEADTHMALIRAIGLAAAKVPCRRAAVLLSGHDRRRDGRGAWHTRGRCVSAAPARAAAVEKRIGGAVKMEKIRQAIDTRLAGQHLPETVYDALCARPARRSRVRRAAALLAAVCVLGGATALAAARLFGMNVNGRELPPLEPMTMVETADTGGPADGTEQQAEGLDALSRALGVPFLWAEGARENPYTRVSYKNFGGEYQIVKAKAYLVGDLRDLVWQDEYDYYSWTAGTVYQTPVDLTLEWVSDEAQQPFDTDYLGYYAYADTFTSAGGHTVNLLVDTAPGTAGSGLKPECAAVFVADGVRYTLSGHVTQQTMRAIVDSMSYA